MAPRFWSIDAVSWSAHSASNEPRSITDPTSGLSPPTRGTIVLPTTTIERCPHGPSNVSVSPTSTPRSRIDWDPMTISPGPSGSLSGQDAE